MSQHRTRGEMPREIHALAMASPQEQKLLNSKNYEFMKSGHVKSGGVSGCSDCDDVHWNRDGGVVTQAMYQH